MISIDIHMSKDNSREIRHFPATEVNAEFWTVMIFDGNGNEVKFYFQDLASLVAFTGGNNG